MAAVVGASPLGEGCVTVEVGEGSPEAAGCGTIGDGEGAPGEDCLTVGLGERPPEGGDCLTVGWGEPPSLVSPPSPQAVRKRAAKTTAAIVVPVRGLWRRLAQDVLQVICV